MEMIEESSRTYQSFSGINDSGMEPHSAAEGGADQSTNLVVLRLALPVTNEQITVVSEEGEDG